LYLQFVFDTDEKQKYLTWKKLNNILLLADVVLLSKTP